MAVEIAKIYRHAPEDFLFQEVEGASTAHLYGMADCGDQFILDTKVDRCNIPDGADVSATISTETRYDSQGKPVTLPFPMIQGVWHESCEFCKYNPYRASSEKQCDACRKP